MAIFKKNKTENETEINTGLPEKLPRHIGFIMDGNGRWANQKGMPRTFGHVQGAKNFRTIVKHCRKIGIECISFYAFSTENWSRPKAEVDAIMKLMDEYLDDARKYFGENTKMIFLGDKSALSENLRNKVIKLEEDTKHHDSMTLMLAVNYGGRDELAYVARQLAQKAIDGEIKPEEITEATVDEHLYTKGMPDVDLIVRPSGEYRLSNFLIWQSAYAEYYFTDILWPDFSPDDLNVALWEFSKRGRRFGGV